ncbi:ChrR family anti-sigma-E factor [Rhizobium sp. 2MFCol3.1]|uniref:ChrR family anti-sigma-E factor n=1 Tax=Rhizobium sp. 2MFCol3.1 TaxID=1246459 RepID=UPI001FD97E83|nr:ChrR family anti-sigma-E factor [Rhizobium sp. 2MFCol3.1]
MGIAAYNPMTRHHIDDEMLMRYAAGKLTEGWGVAVATHLALCPSCRSSLGVYEALGGHFLDSENPQSDDEVIARSWKQLKARIDAGEIGKVIPLRRPAGNALLPEPLRSYVDQAGGLAWRRIGAGGAAQMIVPTGDETTTARLLRIPKGQPVPEHTHNGVELTLVLAGSFSDEISTFRRGDVEMADTEIIHTPRAGEEEDCICLAVTDAPLRFSSRLMRFLQPWLKI